MAKVSPFIFPFSGSIAGNLSLYTRKDCNKPIVRRKGGATKTKIMKAPKMAPVRRQMKRFGGTSKAGKMIRNAMLDINPLMHSFISAELVSVCGKIMKLDTENPLESQSVIFSNGLEMLQGYNLNLVNVFDGVISSPVQFSINKELYRASVTWPALTPGTNFRNPWKQPFFRFRSTFGTIRDLHLKGDEYITDSSDVNDHSLSQATEWNSTTGFYPSGSFDFQMNNVIIDQHCYFILAIGIEFGSPVNGGIMRVKDAGCAKILSVV